MTTLPANSSRPKHLLLASALRVVALVDALALPALLGYWVWAWQSPAPGVRPLLGVLTACWAVKRAYAATVGFGTFKWRLTRLAAAALVVWLVMHLAA